MGAGVGGGAGAQLLVSDDADGFKTAADENGLLQQVCTSHVRRNTEAWVETITPLLEADSYGSLARLGITPELAVADGQELPRLMTERRPSPEARAARQASHRRSLAATQPPQDGTRSLAYRLRRFSLDRWHLWPQLTRYRPWAGPGGETLDGTTKACARAIGWWLNERYRSMRGSKRPESVLHLSRLIAAMGSALDRPGFALAEVIPSTAWGRREHGPAPRPTKV